MIWKPYLSANAAESVSPIEVEHNYPFDVVQLYPVQQYSDPKTQAFKLEDVRALKAGGAKLCLISDERYEDSDSQSVVGTCTHLDILVRQADRILFGRQEALQVAASLMRIGSYEGFWKLEHPQPAKSSEGESSAKSTEGASTGETATGGGCLSGDLPDLKFKEFDPKTLRRFFLATGDLQPGLRFVYGTLAIGDDAAYRFDLDTVTDLALSGRGQPWPNQEFLDYLYSIRQPSGLKPAATEAKDLYQVPYQCLPQRLRWMIWAIRYGDFLIDSADDPTADTAIMSAPSTAGSMRSWHADLKGNLPVLAVPSGGGGTMAQYLEGTAQTWRTEIGRESSLSADRRRTGMNHWQVRKFKWLPSELFKEFYGSQKKQKARTQKKEKSEMYIDEWQSEQRKADEREVRDAVHTYQESATRDTPNGRETVRRWAALPEKEGAFWAFCKQGLGTGWCTTM